MTLEHTLLIPLLDYRAQADRHGIRVEVTVRVPEETFLQLLRELPDAAPETRWDGSGNVANAIAIGGVRFETERT